jgi:hypothetical protein
MPLLTLGLLTSVVVGHASVRLHSRSIAIAGALYAIATVSFLTLAGIYPDGSPPTGANAVMSPNFANNEGHLPQPKTWLHLQAGS